MHVHAENVCSRPFSYVLFALHVQRSGSIGKTARRDRPVVTNILVYCLFVVRAQFVPVVAVLALGSGLLLLLLSSSVSAEPESSASSYLRTMEIVGNW